MSSGKVDIATKLKSEPLETQRLLWASEIQGLQFTVILDRERQARTSVCHLQVAELDGVVSVDEASATTLGIGDSRITVHCDLGSGMQGHLSVTCM